MKPDWGGFKETAREEVGTACADTSQEEKLVFKRSREAGRSSRGRGAPASDAHIPAIRQSLSMACGVVMYGISCELHTGRDPVSLLSHSASASALHTVGARWLFVEVRK